MRQIPLLDVRDGGPIAHAAARIAAARALRDACLAPMPRWGHVCLAPVDRLARSWLRKSASRYFEDLERIAEILGFHGAAALNMSYLFACTTQAFVDASGAPAIRRSLDWPFRGLGRGVEIAWTAGPASGFYNVTWPGAVGVLTAMAPGRFSAVINQAPMRRRIDGAMTYPYDFALNLANALRDENGWPPDHLLRFAFETCSNFEEAVALLAREPLARPVLFTVTGTKPHEIALIERTERDSNVLRGAVVVANDWQEPRPGWRGRMGPENNEARRAMMRQTIASTEPFAWATPPVLNHTTRLVVEMTSARDGGLAARGYECTPWRRLPEPATADFRLSDGAVAA
ncbi:hypothetical protein [Methylosinus sp. Ce-a6]|uniref:hypothetical protein n=1 Tax=Methylosinus sp. Ce-a6 TaxID=2172005 RepID=UPI001358DF10|nr:hypothetical protein [Methylosinus sp. Ce-a6]